MWIEDHWLHQLPLPQRRTLSALAVLYLLTSAAGVIILLAGAR